MKYRVTLLEQSFDTFDKAREYARQGIVETIPENTRDLMSLEVTQEDNLVFSLGDQTYRIVGNAVFIRRFGKWNVIHSTRRVADRLAMLHDLYFQCLPPKENE